MLAPEEDMEIAALKKQGWSISAISRHLGRDRKTVRRYLNGEAEAGVRVRSTTDPFDRVEPYVRQRLADDAHLWSTVLFAEVAALGYGQSYPTFVRKLRERELRPHCEPCSGVKGRATVDICHPPGREIGWDWLELSETPWGEKAFVLVGALSHSSRFRAWITDSDDQAHLVEGIDQVLRRLGGTATEWRVDRMATVINPQTGKVQASFVPVAKHYGVRAHRGAQQPDQAGQAGGLRLSASELPDSSIALRREAQLGLTRHGHTPLKPDEPQIHHLIERSHGGGHHPDNLVLLCWYHHHVAIHQTGMRIDPDSPPHRRRLLSPHQTRPPPTIAAAAD
ncbi:MAG: helix-turn-helix domain-containing protein, partial [Actinomycetota bacterium]